MIPPPRIPADLIRRALQEDIGGSDITTRALFRKRIPAEAWIRAKEKAVLAGLPAARAAFAQVDAKLKFRPLRRDGDRIAPGTPIARIAGDGRSILKGERVALNFLQHLSGIATLTQRFVDAVKGSRARILDTRKTIPGLRELEKYAVRIGGGHNHRRSLATGILIKNNHIALAGSVGEAVSRAKRHGPRSRPVEVEAKNRRDVEEALSGGADIILLDNMPIPDLRDAVKRIDGRAAIEVSGGVGLDHVREIAFLGVDFISVGALTHSAPAVDLHLEIESPKGAG